MVLYVSDLDGTLLNSKQELSYNTINIINNLIENKGMYFTVATGRSINTAFPLLYELKLNHPIILNNGVFIYDPVNKKYIKENYIEYKTGIDTINQLIVEKYHPIINTIDYNNNQKIFYQGIFNPGEKDYVQRRLDNNDKRFYKYDKNFKFPDCKIIQILLIDKKENLEPIYKRLLLNNKIFPNLTLEIYIDYYWLEISERNGNKKDGLSFLKSYLKADKIICFGDNLNDLPMFEISDEKIAVSNAVIDLKKYSTKVIGSNENDGVALYMNDNFIKEERW